MKSFYQSSHWFWVISRVVIVLMFIISMVQIMNEGGPRHLGELVANTTAFFGSLMLAVLAVMELVRTPKPTWLRIAGGVFMVLFGLGLCVVFAMGMVRGGLGFLLLLFVIWFVLAGVRDFVVR